MYTVKRLAPAQEHTFVDTAFGNENRDSAIMIASNIANERARELRQRVRSTLAYVGYITFIVGTDKKWSEGYAVSSEVDK